MLIINLFRQHKHARFNKKEPYEIKNWMQLMEQLIRIISQRNDWDPKTVPEAPPNN